MASHSRHAGKRDHPGIGDDLQHQPYGQRAFAQVYEASDNAGQPVDIAKDIGCSGVRAAQCARIGAAKQPRHSHPAGERTQQIAHAQSQQDIPDGETMKQTHTTTFNRLGIKLTFMR